MKRKSKSKRPIRKEAHELRPGSNPFKANWEFNDVMSFERFLLKDNEKSISRSINYASHDDAVEIKEGRYNPYFVDPKCIRLYKDGNDGFMNLLWSLSPRAHSLLFWIIYHLDYGTDTVLINKQEIERKLGISETTIYVYLGELRDKNIIAKSKEANHYFINVQYMFLGNRSTYFPEFVWNSDGDLNENKKVFMKKHSKKIEQLLSKKKPPESDDKPMF